MRGLGDASAASQRPRGESPLDRFPTKRAKLPEFWQPRGWRRPTLENGKALPDDALDNLGQMLTFPTNEEIYGGIAVVKEVCDAGSLAEFAWDAFTAWLEAGGPSKEGWALKMLELLRQLRHSTFPGFAAFPVRWKRGTTVQLSSRRQPVRLQERLENGTPGQFRHLWSTRELHSAGRDSSTAKLVRSEEKSQSASVALRQVWGLSTNEAASNTIVPSGRM